MGLRHFIPFLSILFIFQSFCIVLVHSAEASSFCDENFDIGPFSRRHCPGGIILRSPLQIENYRDYSCLENGLKLYSNCDDFESNNETGVKQNSKVQILVPSKSGECSSTSEFCEVEENDLDQLDLHNEYEEPQNFRKDMDTKYSGRQAKSHSIHKRSPKMITSYSHLLNIDDQAEQHVNSFVKNMNKWRRQNEEHAEPTKSATPSPSDDIAISTPSSSLGSEESSGNSSSPKKDFKTELAKVKRMVALIDKLSGVDNSEQPSFDGDEKLRVASLFKELFKIADIYQAPNLKIVKPITLKTVEKMFQGVIQSVDYAKLKRFSSRLGTDVLQGVRACRKFLSRQTGLRFIQDETLCPQELIYFVHPATFELIPIPKLMEKFPKDLKYRGDKEDYVMITAWKVFDIAHSACFAYWMEFNYATTPFMLANFVEDLFLARLKDLLPGVGGLSQYEGIIPADKPLNYTMIDLDVLVAATHYVSRFVDYYTLPRQKGLYPGGKGDSSGDNEGVSSNPEEADATPSPDGGDEAVTESSGGERKKRVAQDSFFAQDSEYETPLTLSQGRAYCLQKVHKDVEAGFHNTFPRIQRLCEQKL